MQIIDTQRLYGYNIHINKMENIMNKITEITDFLAPEDVETVCARCDKFAAAWKEEAQKLWDSTSHPNPKTQYYRDKKNR